MKYNILAIILSVFFISACVGGGGISSNGEGIDFQFMTNQPPTDELNENQQFRVGINTINYGLENTEVNLCISDSLSSWVEGVTESCKIINMDKAEISGNQIVPFQKKVYFPFEDTTYRYINIEPNMDTTIVAEAYYKFITIANGQICIKRDIEAETPVECEVSSQEQLTSNSAPVKITSLEKKTYPIGNNKVQLTLKFTVSNSGAGDVIDVNTINSREAKEPKISVRVSLKGITTNFVCNPVRADGRFAFNEKQKTITCEAPIEITQSFIENPLEISVEYGYKLKKTIGPIKLIPKDEGF
ncbi:MAG: hypothetical protein PHD81_02905 [Candidatus Nanoarchaeia archaeon]|nr:hypothetical protein [Candidatus Nanoarchaeia archaeon]MDD5588034.1 hypothetical protein [Candidatus Nanoarchaeia archaeon]